MSVSQRLRRCVILKELSEPLDRRSFVDSSVANEVAREVIRDKHPRRLAVDSKIILGTFRIFRLGSREGEVYREPLEWNSRRLDRVVASRLLDLFRLDTSGASVKDCMHVRELRDPLYMLMSMKEVVVAWVPETLMPEHALRFRLDRLYRRVLSDVFVERHSMILLRGRLEAFPKLIILAFLIREHRLENCPFTCFGKLRIRQDSRFA